MIIGKAILHYKIIEKLGEGGMGVVYKAEDTKLHREVALKFLTTSGVSPAEKERFKREAQAAAALNHANIAHIYAIEEHEDQVFIAMELIAGQSLDERIAGHNGRVPLPIDESIGYAIQIAAALTTAHDKGVVHRDIKSGNVMVTEKGDVKVMDFGLAKLSNRTMVTQQGTTLGTAAYMSPEQAKGEVVDHRTDIWSLGVILYEMISGQLPFKGEYDQAVTYAILHEDPESLTALRTGVPITMDGIIAKALAKDRDMRYQNVEELPADLKALDTASLSRSRISTMTQPTKDSRPSKGSRLPWVVAGVMMLLGAAGLWYGWRANSGDRPVSGVKRVSLPLTQSEGLRIVGRFALSPDGTMLTFLGQSEGREKLYLRHLDKNEITALAGTEGAVRPFFSPDSRWIGFFVGSTLRKVAVEGGTPSDICEAGVATANWGNNDEIIFSDGVSLMRVSAQGGIPELLPTDESQAGGRAILPRILPGGRHVLYTSVPATGAIDEGSIVVQSIESGEKQTLIQGGTNPHYLPTGHIVYESSGTLIAVPFDIGSLTITGPRSPLGEQVSTEATGHANFTMSMDGSMIYSSANLQAGELVWTNRQGVATPVSAPAHSYWDPRLSPDGRQVAVNRRDLSPEIWLLELARGTQTRLTVNPGEDETACWSPDSRWIAFASQRTGHPRSLFRKRVAGSDAEEQLWTSSNHFHVECWSRDGRSIIVADRDPATGDDLWLISLEDEISAQPLLQTRFNEFGGRISPDGRWLAYTSNESGRLEVYVQAFPVLGTKTQISIKGGRQPVWAPNGKELFYRGEGHLMAVIVTPGENFAVTLPKPLFSDVYMDVAAKHTSYDVASDGERFLMLRSDAQNNVTSLNVVFNWFAEVKRLAPGGK